MISKCDVPLLCCSNSRKRVPCATTRGWSSRMGPTRQRDCPRRLLSECVCLRLASPSQALRKLPSCALPAMCWRQSNLLAPYLLGAPQTLAACDPCVLLALPHSVTCRCTPLECITGEKSLCKAVPFSFLHFRFWWRRSGSRTTEARGASRRPGLADSPRQFLVRRAHVWRAPVS